MRAAVNAVDTAVIQWRKYGIALRKELNEYALMQAFAIIPN